jgi:hypothetical protein
MATQLPRAVAQSHETALRTVVAAACQATCAHVVLPISQRATPTPACGCARKPVHWQLCITSSLVRPAATHSECSLGSIIDGQGAVGGTAIADSRLCRDTSTHRSWDHLLQQTLLCFSVMYTLFSQLPLLLLLLCIVPIRAQVCGSVLASMHMCCIAAEVLTCHKRQLLRCDLRCCCLCLHPPLQTAA